MSFPFRKKNYIFLLEAHFSHLTFFCDSDKNRRVSLGENILSVLIYSFYVLDFVVVIWDAVLSLAMTIYTLKEYKCIAGVTIWSSERCM